MATSRDIVNAEAINTFETSIGDAVESAGLLKSVCTIYRATESTDAIGQVTATWAAVDALTDLPCMIAPLVIQRPNQEEQKAPFGTPVMADRWVWFKEQISITEKDRAEVDGTMFDIIAVQYDSQGYMTRLAVRKYQL